MADTRRYKLVETTARLRGKLISSSYSFPAGIGVNEVRDIDARWTRAYGNIGSKTKATPL